MSQKLTPNQELAFAPTGPATRGRLGSPLWAPLKLTAVSLVFGFPAGLALAVVK